MDLMVFEVAELDGAKMIGYLLVLNVSNCYEVAYLYGAHPVFIDV
jgi:hypothetical protein